MQNTVGRNSERDAKGVDSQKHLQRTQHSEQRIMMMFGAEKSVALKHEESEDPRLIHKPYAQGNCCRHKFFRVSLKSSTCEGHCFFSLGASFTMLRCCTARTVHEVDVEENRILESVNYELGTHAGRLGETLRSTLYPENSAIRSALPAGDSLASRARRF